MDTLCHVGRNTLAGPVTAYIAGELRAQKSRHQWSIDQIANRSGLARSTVDRALKGTTALSIEVLLPLCDAMELDALQLLRGAGGAGKSTD